MSTVPARYAAYEFAIRSRRTLTSLAAPDFGQSTNLVDLIIQRPLGGLTGFYAGLVHPALRNMDPQAAAFNRASLRGRK